MDRHRQTSQRQSGAIDDGVGSTGGHHHGIARQQIDPLLAQLDQSTALERDHHLLLGSVLEQRRALPVLKCHFPQFQDTARGGGVGVVQALPGSNLHGVLPPENLSEEESDEIAPGVHSRATAV